MDASLSSALLFTDNVVAGAGQKLPDVIEVAKGARCTSRASTTGSPVIWS
jgi:hypothetical protein